MSDIWNGTKTAFMDGGSGSSVYAPAEMPLNFTDDTLVTLLGSDDTAYTFDATDGDYVADIFDAGTTATEFSGTGYNPGTDGVLGTKTITEDNTNDRAEFGAADVTFSGLDGDAIQFALICKQVGADLTTPTDDPLVAYITSADFPLTTNGGDVTISWNAEGIVHIT